MGAVHEKNQEIEYLRAISICMVLFAHAPLISSYVWTAVTPLFKYFSGGAGVDLFFCISGYVVSKSYFSYFDKHAAQGDFWVSAKMFWLRRAYRLLPSAWLWVFVGIFCSVYFNSTGVFLSFEENLKSGVAVATFVQNFVFAAGRGIGANDVYWSLSLEEQFYFIFPFFLLVVKGRNRVFVLAALILVQFFLHRSWWGDQLPRYLMAVRIDGFAWGVLIYMLSRTALYRRIQPELLGRFKPLALLVTIAAIYMISRPSSSSIHMGLVALCAALLVWLASYNKGYIFGYGDPVGVLNWLGGRSYAIYLIHEPVFRLVHELLMRYLNWSGQHYVVTFVPYQILLVVVLILVLSELNFRFVEVPLRNRGSRIARARLDVLDKSRVSDSRINVQG